MFKDIKLKAELDFLTAVERGEVITQMTLKQKIGISVGLTNALLKRAVNKGFVKVKRAPYKRYAYYLTPHGFAEKSRLVSQYLETSLSFLRDAREQYAALIDQELHKGHKRFVLVGGGELAEIAILAAMGKKIDAISVLDEETQERPSSGTVVLNTLSDLEHYDVVIITDAKKPQEAFEKIFAAFPEKSIRWPPILRITPDKEDLLLAMKMNN